MLKVFMPSAPDPLPILEDLYVRDMWENDNVSHTAGFITQCRAEGAYLYSGHITGVSASQLAADLDISVEEVQIVLDSSKRMGHVNITIEVVDGYVDMSAGILGLMVNEQVRGFQIYQSYMKGMNFQQITNQFDISFMDLYTMFKEIKERYA